MAVYYDRPCVLFDDWQVIVRQVPAFVERVFTWSKVIKEELCPFCKRISSKTAVRVPFDVYNNKFFKTNSLRGLEMFNVENDYPYTKQQRTWFWSKHSDNFTFEHLAALLNVIEKNPFAKTAGVQLLGSGASIPAHFHFSTSSETLPILRSLKLEDKIKLRDVELHLNNTPFVSFTLKGVQAEEKCIELWKAFLKDNINVNIIATYRTIVVVPRKQQSSSTLNRKVGISLVSGLYPCYLSQTQLRTCNSRYEALRLMNEHWQSVTPGMLEAAIRETTFSRVAEIYG